MIHRKNVETTSDPLFPFCWGLYISAFPEEERRGLDYHAETMAREQFHCDVVVDDDEPIGILFWWDLRDFTFVEHLATTAAVRGRGYGAQILDALIEESEKPILLEVEHPTDDISRRRIGFYERVGFVMNEYPYRHPSYQQREGEFVELMVMTHPKHISKSVLENFMREEFPIVHFRSF